MVKLLGEASIGAGKRRIEGLVGADAFGYLAREHLLVSQLSALLNVGSDDVLERVGAVIARVRELEKDIERVRGEAVLSGAGPLAETATIVEGISVVAHRAPDETDADDLRKLVQSVLGQLASHGPAAVAIAAVTGGRPIIVIAVNDPGRERGLKAGELVRDAAAELGGGGGGRDDLAQGGGSDAGKLDGLLADLPAAIARRTSG
jgi:alanyl-tRNA synthetase